MITAQSALAAPLGVSRASGGPVDPFTIICHSGGATADADTGSTIPATDYSCCDHCVLCHAAPAANAPDEAAYLIPPPRSTRLAPFLTAEPGRTAFFPQSLARGPPSDV